MHLGGQEVLQSMLPPAERRRLELFSRSEEAVGLDVLGVDVGSLSSAYAFAYWLHRAYFRVVSWGHEHVPVRGAAVLVGNHGGVLPFDALMVVTDVFRRIEPARLLHCMVEHFVYRWPFLGVYFRQLGQVAGTRRNFASLVESGRLVGVFPEGAAGLIKPRGNAYRLAAFNPGHLELAARHHVPIIPVGVVGSEEQMTLLTNLEGIARLLHLPFLPLTTTFLVPKPVHYYIAYGPPVMVDDAVLHDDRAHQDALEGVRRAVRQCIQSAQEVRRRALESPC